MHFSSIVLLIISTVLVSTSATEEDASGLRRRAYELPYEAPAEEDEPTRRIFVKYRRHRRSAFKTEISKRSSKMKMNYDFQDMDTFVLTVPESEVKALKDNPDVEMVHDDVPRYPQYIADSVQRRELQSGDETPYGIDLVQAKDVWALGARGQGVTVCIVDTGVDQTHEDLKGVTGLEDDLLKFGEDSVGHGTHCAGTVAAVENGKGVVGVAPDAKIYSVKVFDGDGGFAYSSSILSAAKECAENGADIISMSLGGPLPNVFEIFGFRQLLKDNGVISVAAAGNGGNGMWSFPASYPGVVSVAALDENKKIAPFSQSNRQVDIAAPGVDVMSTFPMKAPCLICESKEEYGYGTISGTSMATPHVAGVLALLKSFKPTATPEELIDAMEKSAEDLGRDGKDKKFGHGLVQALAAAELLNGGALAESFSQQPDKSSDCGNDEMMFDLKMLTDDHARETYWELRRITDSGVQLAGAGYDDNTAVAVMRCIPKNCYTFTVYDSAGDGLCCSHGNGSYSVSVDGERVITNAGDFREVDMTTFGACVEDTPDKK